MNFSTEWTIPSGERSFRSILPECYLEAKKRRTSFFLCSLHRILTAVNRIEAFRYRIENGEVVCYDRIHASPTIGREDGSFGYGFFEYFS